MEFIRQKSDCAAVLGDILIVEDNEGDKYYYLFCDDEQSNTADAEGLYEFFLVNLENGYIEKWPLKADEDIRVGSFVTTGTVVDIVENCNIKMTIK